MIYRKILLLIVFAFNITAYSQNCGVLDSITYTIVDNGNGTSNYTFVGYFSTTSGGSKSVDMSIYCGSYNFVSNDCHTTSTTQTTQTYGPYNNVTTCTGTIFIDWIGKTNSACGGSTCGGQTGVTPVPVELIDFRAEKISDHHIKLSWETASEMNNEKFVIQRKTSGDDNFYDVGEKIGAGSTNDISEYECIDDISLLKRGKIYYRLKQVDYDGAFEFSKVVTIYNSKTVDIAVYPNPAKTHVQVSTMHEDGFFVRLRNVYGKLVFEDFINESKFQLQLNGFSNGVYNVEVQGIDEKNMEVRKLVIAK